MAKIKQVKIRLDLDPSRPYKETVVNICYDATDRRSETFRRPIPSESQRFYINLPKVVADALGENRVRDKDQVEVFKRFEEALERFKHMESEVNRVIIYEFDIEPKPDAKYGLYAYGLRVAISAGTFEETVMTAGDGVKRYSYEWIESEVNTGERYGSRVGNRDGQRENRQVPWTKKNEAFFVWIKRGMKELMEKLYELEQPEKLIEMVHAGRLLPLGNPESSK